MYHILVLLTSSCIPLGGYFAYDAVGSKEAAIMEGLGIQRSDIGMLYAVYALPNIILVFFGGVAADKLGVRMAALIFVSLVIIGAIIVAAAPNFIIMLLGRFIFGCGQESLTVTQSRVMGRWFRGKELALSFGFSLTVARAGTWAAFIFLPYVSSWRLALWLAAATCLFSGLCTLGFCVLDRIGARHIELDAGGEEIDCTPALALTEDGDEETVVKEQAEEGTGVEALEPEIDLDLDLDLEIKNEKNTNDREQQSMVEGEATGEEENGVEHGAEEEAEMSGEGGMATQPRGMGGKMWKFVLSVWNLPITFWLVAAICAFFYGCIFPWVSFAPDFIQSKYGYSHQATGLLISSISLTSMILSPIFGILIDWIGKRATILAVGGGFMIPTHLYLGLTSLSPLPAVATLGLAISLVPSALWASVPLIVVTESQGMAFGLITSLQNVGLFLVPLIIGWLRDATGSYTAGQIFFAFLGFLALVCSILLWIFDRKRRILELPSEQYRGRVSGAFRSCFQSIRRIGSSNQPFQPLPEPEDLGEEHASESGP